jgi:hypothetical protein
MSSTHLSLHFHVVFSTKNREPRIAAALISTSAIYGEQNPSTVPPGLKHFFATEPPANFRDPSGIRN